MTFEEFLDEWNNGKDFIVAHTSGSTGSPKEILLSKDFVAQSAQRTNDFFRLTENSHLHSCVSPDFIGGKMMGVRALISGASLTWETPSNQPLAKLDPKYKIDLLAVVPSQMLYILDNRNSLPEIKNVIIGGSSIHPELRKKIAESGINAYETYGMTETASHIALRKVTREEPHFDLLPGIKISTDDEGCLIIGFENGYSVKTNDIAVLVSETQFHIRGRKDLIIISGGRKINPIEVERKISKLISVPYLITSVPDPKWGEKVILLIETAQDSPSLMDEIKKILQPWEIPKEIRLVTRLPRTPNGKLQRKLLTL